MKKVVYILIGVLLVMSMLSGGCTTAPPQIGPTPPVTGNLTGVSDTAVTVQTPQGPTAVQVTPQTGFSFDGQFCTLDDLRAKITSNQSYNCTIVYDDQLGALGVYVTGTGGNVSGMIPPGITP